MSKPILVLNYEYTKDVEARIARDYTVRRVARESPGRGESSGRMCCVRWRGRMRFSSIRRCSWMGNSSGGCRGR